VGPVNTVDRAHLESMNETTVDAAAHLEEPVLAGVAMTASSVVTPQRVASAPAAMECRLSQTVVSGSSTVVFGRVVAVHVADHLWRDGGWTRQHWTRWDGRPGAGTSSAPSRWTWPDPAGGPGPDRWV